MKWKFEFFSEEKEKGCEKVEFFFFFFFFFFLHAHRNKKKVENLLTCRRSKLAERRYLSMLMSSLTWNDGTSGSDEEEELTARVPPPPDAGRGIERPTKNKKKKKKKEKPMPCCFCSLLSFSLEVCFFFCLFFAHERKQNDAFSS